MKISFLKLERFVNKIYEYSVVLLFALLIMLTPYINLVAKTERTNGVYTFLFLTFIGTAIIRIALLNSKKGQIEIENESLTIKVNGNAVINVSQESEKIENEK